MALDIVPFHAEHVSRGGELLAARWRAFRAALPLSPQRFEHPDAARATVEALLKHKHARGFAALRDGQLLGYLIGELDIGDVWGRSAWVRLGGCAVALTAPMDVLADLYAALGQHWVEMGVFLHYAQTPALDRDQVDAWFALNFGMQQTYALASLDDTALRGAVNPDIEVRRATLDDRDALASMSNLIRETLTSAPAWAATLPEREADIRAGYAGLVDDADATVWLAFMGGRAVGMQVWYAATPADDAMLIGEGCVELSIGATVAEARGRGVTRALTQRASAYERERGARVALTDWRSANLLAARAWPRFGFRPAMLRLHRHVDERVAWGRSFTPARS